MTATCPGCGSRDAEAINTITSPLDGRTLEVLRCVDCGGDFYV